MVYKQFTNFLLFFFSFTLSTFSQKDIGGSELLFINYTTRDGLPSNEIHDIEQDNDGFLWIATDRGLSRFDGSNFINYSTADGLLNNSVLGLKKHGNRIYYYTLSNEIGFIENNKFFEKEISPEFISKTKDKSIFSFDIDPQGNILIGTGLGTGSGTYVISPNGEIRIIHPSDDILATVFQSFNSYAFSVNSHGNKILFVRGEERDSFLIENPIGINDKKQHNKKTNLLIKENTLFYSVDRILYVFDKETNYYKKRIFDTTIDRIINAGERITISTKENNMEFSLDSSLSIYLKNCFLQNAFLSSYYQDHEAGQWYSSTNSGLFYRPAKYPSHLKTINEYDNIHSTIRRKSDSLLLISNGKFIYSYSNKFELEKTYDYDFPIVNFFNVKDYLIAFPRGERARIDKIKKNRELINDNARVIYPFASRDKFLWMGISNLVKSEISYLEDIHHLNDSSGLYNTAPLHRITNSPLLTTRLRCILPINDSLLLGGNQNLLFLVKFFSSGNEVIKIDHPLLNHRIEDIIAFEDLFLVATLGNGIVLLNNNFEVIDHLSISNGLSSNIINDLERVSDKIIASSIYGMDELEIINDSLKFIRSLNSDYNIPVLNTKQTTYFQEKLIANTHLGFLIFDLNRINIKENSKLRYLVDFNQSANEKSILKLPYDHTPIKISFLPINFTQKEIEYEYKINEKDWEAASQNFQLSELSHGDYTIKLRSKHKGSDWVIDPNVYEIEVSPPFWLTTWFLILSVLLLSALIYIPISYYYRNLQEKTNLKLRSQKAELQALRMQMNPHFLFNLMSSLQGLIFKKKSREAIVAISSFTKMLRRVLHNSNREWISLQEELDLLENYVLLEKSRLVEDFDYSIYTENISLQSIYIPSMIIQPFVENAIWHGIGKLNDRKGKITIHFEQKNKGLICIITDNGVGYNPSQELKKRHNSIALENIKQRMASFNEMMSSPKKMKFKYEIINLENHSNSLKGTKILLYIPTRNEAN